MHGTPDGEAFAFLGGKRLDQLCFGRHQLQLRFDENVCVSVEGDIRVQLPGSEEVVMDATRAVATALVSALATCVTGVVVSDFRSFSMTFENGLSVRVIDSAEHYESFQISDGGRLIMV